MGADFLQTISVLEKALPSHAQGSSSTANDNCGSVSRKDELTLPTYHAQAALTYIPLPNLFDRVSALYHTIAVQVSKSICARWCDRAQLCGWRRHVRTRFASIIAGSDRARCMLNVGCPSALCGTSASANVRPWLVNRWGVCTHPAPRPSCDASQYRRVPSTDAAR